MIHYATAYRTDKDLGKAYNEIMEQLPKLSDWACFTDGDAMFTNLHFGTQIEEIIKANSECKLFTATTNRIGNKYQCVKGMWHENDMSVHFAKSKDLIQQYGTKCLNITNNTPLSGVLILIQKKEWLRVGKFTATGKALGVDNNIHYSVQKHGGLVYMMQGVYMLHYYRNGNINDKKHLA